jgi:tetratricopeptide (TPR) repeat protein
MNKALAMVTTVVTMLWIGPAAAEQSAEGSADALFQQGVELFRDGDFASARESFQGSYDTSPTPALRFNIGVCHYNLGQWAEARQELTAYLAQTDPALITAERRQQVDGLLQELDGRLGPAAPPDQPAITPPEPAVERPSPDPAGPQPEPHRDRRRLSQTWFWVTASLAAALAVGGGVTGGLALGTESDFDDLVSECNSGERQGCYDDGVVLRDRADALAAATNALFATAGVAAVTALVLAFFTDWHGDEEGANLALNLSPLGGASTRGLLLDLRLRF